MSDFVTYSFAGARVSVRFEAPGFSEWLDEVLHPAFDRVEADTGAVTVAAHRASTAAPRQETRATTEVLPWFTFDHEVVTLPSRRNGEVIDVLDGKYGAGYVVHTEPRLSVDVHADGPWPRTRAALLRVVRELAVSQVLAGGRSVRLHASGVERAGAVVLFAGPKGAGKTTLLARLASATGAGVVTNDCAVVTRSAARSWGVSPVPISISVRPGTLERLPGLFADVADVETLMQYTRAEAADALEQRGPVTAPRRIRLSPALFAQSVGGRLSPGGRLAAIVLLSADPSGSSTTIRDVPVDEAQRRLPAMRYGVDGSTAPRTMLARFVDPDDGAAAEAGLITQLAREVPCVDVEVGSRVLDDRDAACELLDRLVVV
jgi:predicted ATPase